MGQHPAVGPGVTIAPSLSFVNLSHPDELKDSQTRRAVRYHAMKEVGKAKRRKRHPHHHHDHDSQQQQQQPVVVVALEIRPSSSSPAPGIVQVQDNNMDDDRVKVDWHCQQNTTSSSTCAHMQQIQRRRQSRDECTKTGPVNPVSSHGFLGLELDKRAMHLLKFSKFLFFSQFRYSPYLST